MDKRRLATLALVASLGGLACGACSSSKANGPLDLGDSVTVCIDNPTSEVDVSFSGEPVSASGSKSVQLDAVSLNGASNLDLVESSLSPIAGDVVGPSLGWPSTASSDTSAWSNRVPLKGARIEPGTARFVILLHLRVTSMPASFDSMTIDYASGQDRYRAQSSWTLHVRSAC